MSDSRKIVLAITGASGVVYSVRLLEVLLAAGCDVLLTISAAGQAVLKHELGLIVDLAEFDPDCLTVEIQPDGTVTPIATKSQNTASGKIFYDHYQDFFSAIASGSSLTDGMVICPCSGSTLGAIVHATGNNLIHRAADVHLKEHRPLVLVPRETPLSAIQLENMHRAAQAGAIVLPAMPGYYHSARTVRDLVDFVVARICDQLKVQHNLIPRWGDSAEESST
jgi:4-hydroxy-3-polyprenylbenzoate decarboxylase